MPRVTWAHLHTLGNCCKSIEVKTLKRKVSKFFFAETVKFCSSNHYSCFFLFFCCFWIQCLNSVRNQLLSSATVIENWHSLVYRARLYLSCEKQFLADMLVDPDFYCFRKQSQRSGRGYASHPGIRSECTDFLRIYLSPDSFDFPLKASNERPCNNRNLSKGCFEIWQRRVLS